MQSHKLEENQPEIADTDAVSGILASDWLIYFLFGLTGLMIFFEQTEVNAFFSYLLSPR